MMEQKEAYENEEREQEMYAQREQPYKTEQIMPVLVVQRLVPVLIETSHTRQKSPASLADKSADDFEDEDKENPAQPSTNKQDNKAEKKSNGFFDMPDVFDDIDRDMMRMEEFMKKSMHKMHEKF